VSYDNSRKQTTRECVFSYACKYIDLDPMTLILDHVLDVINMYTIPNMKFLGQGFKNFEQDIATQTDRRDRTYYHAAFARGKN